MRTDMVISQKLSQQMILAPRMIQSMEILTLPAMALQERIQQELEENPVLEVEEKTDDTFAEADEFGYETNGSADNDAADGELVIEDSNTNELDFDRLEAMNKDWGDSFNDEHRPSRNGSSEEGDRKYDAMQNMASRPQTLQEYLNDQLSFLDIPKDLLPLVRHVIAHVDGNGFLSIPDESGASRAIFEAREDAKGKDKELDGDEEEEIEKSTPRRCPSLEEMAATFERPVTTAQVEEALMFVQKLDPPGVGARDLKECLYLQLTPETHLRNVVSTLILHHLEDISSNRLPSIQKRTGLELSVIKEAIEEIRHLNPRPGACFSGEHAPHVIPDIKVERTEDGEYTVQLFEDWLPTICISQKWIDSLRDKSTDPKTKEYLKRKIQSAQWLQESILQRRATLEKVTRAIIEHQRSFFEKGPEFIEPLKMQQIADKVGVHVTTVSRAVVGKYMQTPRGVFSLKRFFGGAATTANGAEVAWETIKGKLLELIDKEDKANPLSDEEIVNLLNEAGYPVARRTVTKYRDTLHIPSSRHRKDWTA